MFPGKVRLSQWLWIILLKANNFIHIGFERKFHKKRCTFQKGASDSVLRYCRQTVMEQLRYQEAMIQNLLTVNVSTMATV